MPSINEIQEEQFDSEVLQSGVLTGVIFKSEFCSICKQVIPILENLVEKYAGKLKVVKLDIVNQRKAALNNRVFSIPTLIFFKEGKELIRNSGFITAADLNTLIEKHL
jgi:thioredoxin 1